MNPFQFPKELLKDMTILFTIERDNILIGSAHGFFCGKDYPSTIQIVENTDIKNGDWLIDSTTNQRYYAKETRPIVVGGEPSDWMVKYQTEQDYTFSHCNTRSTTINISSVNGNSVIGSQENVTLNIGSSLSDIKNLIDNLPISEQPQAKELFDELQKTESSMHPVLVEGALSKFSNLLKKHTDLLTAVGGWAVQLLIGKN